jgi:uncharacterized protein HemX
MNQKWFSPALLLILGLALATAAVGQDQNRLQKRTIQLNSDLTAQVIAVGRDITSDVGLSLVIS